MILEAFGVLSTAQDLTSGSTTDSENVIKLSAIKDVGFGDLWLSVETETIATGDSSDTYQFQLVLSEESTLDTNIQILSRTITDFESEEIANTNRAILSVNVGQMIGELKEAVTDLYLGLISTISAGATISINAALSPSQPRTKDNTQVIRSNVGLPA
jgi:hypothetical protein